MSFFLCNFAAQNRGFAVFSPRQGNMSFGGANTGHIEKASYALCFGDSESRKFYNYQNIAAQRCSLVCIWISYARIVRIGIYIRRGL